ncbi:MAG: hypothetical protein IJO72_01925 [Oscillospiraceae bacterium]|nr:hypothetical protein [Oscillospiraceae bacterium]
MSKKKAPLRKAAPAQTAEAKKWWQKADPLLLFSFLISTLFLLVCSKSSPLYPMNDWVDVNCFFTMGKSILHGIVPYQDLYEQKGPVLYFMYAIAALISDKSFIGVFMLEVVTFGLFLYFSGKIAQIYLGKSPMAYFIIVFLAALIPISPAFSHGGGCEELCLFMLTYSLYSVLLALNEKRLLTFREAFVNGIFAAAVLYIKFTIVGFYMGLAAFVLMWYLSDGFQWKALFTTIGQFLLGAGALSAVVFGYFAIHGAVGDFMEVYFYNNLNLYPQETEGTKWELIEKCLDTTLKNNSTYGWMIWLGILLFAMDIKAQWKGLIMAFMSFIGLAIGTYWGGRGYTYYGLILAAFCVFGLIAIGKALQLVQGNLDFGKWLNSTGMRSVIMIVLVFLLLNHSYDKSSNTYLMEYEKDDMPAYRFAKIINTVEDARILNYGFLDGGFYYASDVLPSCEFFCTLNIEHPDMWQTHRNAMLNGEFDFVITRTVYSSDYWNPEGLGYELIDQATFYFEGRDFTYYLYRLIEK